MPTLSLYFGQDFLDPKWAGRTYKLDGPTGHRQGGEWALGRAPDCDLTIEIKNVSRRHAAITYSYLSDRWTLQDLGSNTGTILNSMPLTTGIQYPIKIGDRFYLGSNRINVCEDEQDTVNDLGPPTLGSTEPITTWPTPTELPPAPAPAPAPAPSPAPAPRGLWDTVYHVFSWAVSASTPLGVAWRLLIISGAVALTIIAWQQ